VGRIVRAKEIYPKYKLWTAPVRIQQPNYVGYIDVTVTAANATDARKLMRSQYGVEEWHIGSVKEIQ